MFASSTLREPQNDKRSKVSLPANASSSTQTPQGQPLLDRGWQQPLDHPGAQPACRVKDAEGTAKPLVLDSVRWLCYSRNVHIPKLRRNPAPKAAHERGGLPRERWRCFRSLTAQTAALLSLSRPRQQPQFQMSQTLMPYKKADGSIHHPLRVCLKRDNPQVRVDFSSVQGINPKA